MSDTTLLRQESFVLGFTQSEIGTWDDCAEKWYLGYNHMLKRKGAWARYFVYGDAFHRTVSDWYRDGSEKVARLQFPTDAVFTGDDYDWRDLWQGILEVQMRRYFHYYADDLLMWTPFLNEEIVTVEKWGIKFTGKIDLGHVVDGHEGIHILTDHKSASRIDMNSVLGWHYRFQFMFYMWLAEQATGRKIHKFVVNGLQKPSIKIKQGESVESFLARLEQDMIQRPEFYFKRIPLNRIQGSMEHFERRVLMPKVERIRILTQGADPVTIDSLVRNQNTNNCVKYGSVCQFLPICQNGWNAEKFQYIQRESKHEELEEE